jgi:hypothetical protein
MPFRHPDRSHDLATRIEFEVRERLEEAIDYVCLEALVRERRGRGLPPPAAESQEDRRAYTNNVLAFLRLLRRELTPPPGGGKVAQPSGDEQAELLTGQVALARSLPDYWQRYEILAESFLAGTATPKGAGSGGESRGLLGRLFGGR